MVTTALVTPPWLLVEGASAALLSAWGAVVALAVGGVLHARRRAARHELQALAGRLLADERIHVNHRAPADEELARELNPLLAACDEQVAEIASSASRLVPISRELADSFMLIKQKSEMQNRYGNQVAESVRELETLRLAVHEQNQAIGSAVDEAVAGTGQSRDTVGRTEESMHTLAESTDRAASQIDVLSNVNEEIVGITQAIADVAEATNLLALNAAIEAARAGEHGRGFAVVADEVRRLAQQTQEATTQIRSLSDSISRESANTVAQIRQAHEDALITQGQMSQTATEIERVLQAVETIKGLSDDMTDVMANQARVSESAQGDVASLVELNSSVVLANQSQTVSETDLQRLGLFLRRKIERFTTSEDKWDESLRSGIRSPNETDGPAGATAETADQGDVELF